MPLNLLSEIDFTAMPAEQAAAHFSKKAGVTDDWFTVAALVNAGH